MTSLMWRCRWRWRWRPWRHVNAFVERSKVRPPEGRGQLLGERWKARCTAGAGVGDALVIEAVEQITLVVGKPGSDLAQNM